ncbi:hypothetical protein WJX81_001959 [Elliptochloris bilobata]|uniref:OCRE domain-containing protein n=1 Tax=Elliptochloris bilobata TaxID=381761 RepID=A0AAW1S5Q5_9CHLO
MDDEVPLGGVRADANELAEGEEPAGPVKGTNPERAAARRLARRRELQEALALEDELSLLEAIAEAEEEYAERDDSFWSNSGVPIEPFHLRSERQGGYFDAEGTYIEFRNREVPDAWLDSLPQAEEAAGACEEEEGEGEEPGPMASDKGGGEAATPLLSDQERRERKAALAALLQPGEAALDGLRRLGGLQRPEGGARAAWRRRRRNGAGADADTPAQHPAPRLRSGRTVPAENLDAFNRMTELSSVLLAAGDFTIHSRAREALLRELAGGAEGGAEHQGNSDYVFDQASGCYYSSTRGCWFDPERNLYADAASGQWFAVSDNGQPQLVQ